jgi:fructose-specific phosphotransferase system IIC component
MERLMANIPTSFYAIVGVLIVANFSSLIALIVFIFKAGMFVADTKAGISDAKETGVRAHKRIDKLEATQ